MRKAVAFVHLLAAAVRIHGVRSPPPGGFGIVVIDTGAYIASSCEDYDSCRDSVSCRGHRSSMSSTESWEIEVSLGCGFPERYAAIWHGDMTNEDDYSVERAQNGQRTIRAVCVHPEATPEPIGMTRRRT